MKPKFIIGGIIILGVIVLLIVFSAKSSGQYYLTVEELLQRKTEMQGEQVRLSGVVLDGSISYDPQAPLLRFEIAHVPADMKEVEANGGLEAVLSRAANDSSLPKIWVEYRDVKPDTLKPEVQAILTGTLGEDGVFHADKLLLKCPSKYEAK